MTYAGRHNDAVITVVITNGYAHGHNDCGTNRYVR
jgi:hypothetical protein